MRFSKISSFALILIACIVLFQPFVYVEGRWGKGGGSGYRKRKEAKLEAEIQEQVMKEAQDWTEQEILERVQELKLLKMAEIEERNEKKQSARDPHDKWANGYYVRCLFVVCVVAVIILVIAAFKDGLGDEKAQKSRAGKYQ